MKQVGKWLKPKYIIALSIIIAGIYIFIRFFSTKKLSSDTDQIYKTIATEQYEAMRTFGTDENTLFDSLKILNGEELIKVYNAFSLRAYTIGGGGFSIWGYALAGTMTDLFGWYKNELSDQHLAQMRQIWAKSKMRLTF